MARTPATADHDDEDLEDLSYRDAVDELETILSQLEDDEVDIDQLSRRVRRAAALIRLCQERIAGARLEVEHVVADLALATDRLRGRDGEPATEEGDLDADLDAGEPDDGLDGADGLDDRDEGDAGT